MSPRVASASTYHTPQPKCPPPSTARPALQRRGVAGGQRGAGQLAGTAAGPAGAQAGHRDADARRPSLPGGLGCSGGFFQQRPLPRLRPAREAATGQGLAAAPRGPRGAPPPPGGRAGGWGAIPRCRERAAPGPPPVNGSAAGAGRGGGRGLAAQTGLSASARGLPDRSRRPGGPSAGSAKHLPGGGREGVKAKPVGCKGTQQPRGVARERASRERVGSEQLTATGGSAGETLPAAGYVLGQKPVLWDGAAQRPGWDPETTTSLCGCTAVRSCGQCRAVSQTPQGA